MAFSKLMEADGAPATAMVVALLCFVYALRKLNSPKLPPGPFALPIIGNLHQLGMLPHRSLEHLAHKYGPIMYLRFGSFPTLVVSSSEMARELLTTHDLAFAGRPSMAAYLAYNQKPLSLAPYGDHFRRVKKMLMTQLLSAKRFESFRFVREEEVSKAMRSLWEESKEGTVAVNVSRFFISLSRTLIWQMLAGSIYSEEHGEGGLVCNEEIADMAEKVIGSINAANIGDTLPLLGWLDVQGVRKKMREANDLFDKLVQIVIDEHAAAVKKSTHESNVKSVIDSLLEMAQADDALDIKAIIFVLLFSAIETTPSSLEWAMTELLRNTEIAKKLEQEIDSVAGKGRMVRESDLPSMEYLRCVVKETLRLHPPGPLMVPHESTQACTVGPDRFVIPEKTRLLVNVWAIQRDPASWEDPVAFKPERFMGEDVDIIKGRDFQMISFGAGRRSCPGIHMALGTVQLVLSQIFHCFHWRLESDPSSLDMSEALGIALRRKNNLLAIPTLKFTL